MSNTKRTIAKNATVLMGSQVVTWTLSLILAIYLPRYLGVVGMGKLTLARSLWAIAVVFVGFGMSGLITKEIARDHEKTSDLFNTTIITRTLLFIVGFLGVVLFSKIAGYPDDTLSIVFIIGISSLLAQYAGASRAGLEGVERMEFIALSDVVSKAVNVLITVIFVLLGFDIFAIAAVSIISMLVMLSIQVYFLNRLQRLRIRLDFSKTRWLLRSSIPYFVTGFSIVLYHQIDTIIISLLVGEVGVGLYGVVDTLFGTLLFVPMVFFTAVYPALSRMHAENPDSMPKVMSKSFDILLMIGVPMGFGLVVVANSLVVLLYGAAFADSGPILAIKGIVMIFTYQTMLIGTFLISIDRQKPWAIVMATAAFATIPLDIFFVPIFETVFNNGAMGAAWAYLITEIGMVIAGFSLLPKGTLKRANLWLTVKVVLAGLIMFIASWYFRSDFIAIPIIIGIIAYAISIMLLRVIPDEDWLLFKKLGQEIMLRITRRRAKTSEIGG